MSSNTLSQIPIFAPTQISGCQLWLDGQDPNANGVLPANGANVSTWNDKSGNARNASAGGTSPTYTLSTKGVTFGGAGYMNTSYSASLSVESLFVVFNCPSLTNFQQLLGSQINGRQMFFGSAGKIYVKVTGTANELINSPNSTVSNGVTAIVEYIHDGTTPVLYANGSLSVTGTNYAFTAGKTSVLAAYDSGGGYFDPYTGSMFEIIGYYSAVTTSQRQQVEGYLAWKWGLQTSLPSNHPYRNTPVYSTTTLPPQFRNIGTVPMAPSSTPFVFGFNPVSIGNCGLWLDAADTSTLTYQSGSNVSVWTDKSAGIQAQFLTNSMATARAGASPGGGVGALGATNYPVSGYTINGINCLYFNQAILQAITTQNVNTRSYFLVVNVPSPVAGGVILWPATWSVDTYARGGSLQLSSTQVVFASQNVANLLYLNYSPSTSFIISITFNSGTPGMWNTGGGTTASTGQSSSTLSPLSDNYLWIGGVSGAYASPFYIGEFLEYNVAVSTTQRQQVEGYLAWKWGLPASLPSNHPYKNAPPGLTIPVVPTNRQLSNRFFQPTNFSSCLMWLDAADTSTITGTSTVTAWVNKGTVSVSANNTGTGAAGTCTSGSVTQNGLNIVRCPAGAGLSITFASPNQARAWFIVAKNTTQMSPSVLYWAVVNQTVGAGQDNPFGPGAYSSGGNTYTMTSGPSGITATIQTVTAPEPYNVMKLYTWHVSAVTTTLNTINVNGSPMVLSKNILGASFRTDSVAYKINTATYNTGADIAEIIFYNTEMTVAQRQTVEGYLAWKWGLQASLPSTHPYAKWPPPPS